jgi:hypothetical protein
MDRFLTQIQSDAFDPEALHQGQFVSQQTKNDASK